MSEERIDNGSVHHTRTDALTGIADRQSFDAALARMIREVYRTRGALCLLLADVDRFTAVNDVHGYSTGDEILRVLAQELAQCVTRQDVLARYQDETFAILLPGASYAAALVLAESIRAIIGARVMETGDGCSIEELTVSLGVAEYREPEDAAAFVARAADCLLQSKIHGRNRVTGDRDLFP